MLDKYRDNPNKAVRLWLDRMRKYFGKQVRHFIVGEFGDKTHRFHYHGLLFNIPLQLDKDLLESLWGCGFAHIGWCKDKTINYIVKYISKNDNKEVKKDIPRLIVSKGLGSRFADYAKDEPIKTQLKPYIVYKQGAKVPLPKYLQDKIYDIDDKCQMVVNNLNKPFERFVNGKVYHDKFEFEKARKEFAESQIHRGISLPRKIVKRLEFVPLDWSGSADPFECDINLIEAMRNKSVFLIEDCPF